MRAPTPFGVMLRRARKSSRLSQSELAVELGKTPQYISNIEKGKNNSPPDDADLRALIEKLGLNPDEAGRFRLLAYADRGMLPPEMFRYVSDSPSLIGLINYAISKGVPEDYWNVLMKNIPK